MNNLNAFKDNTCQDMTQLMMQINEAGQKGNFPLYFQLKNQAILSRIDAQRTMLGFCVNVHEGVQKLFNGLKPIEEAAKARNGFVNPSMYQQIENEFKTVDEVLNELYKKMQRKLDFIEKESVSLEKGRLYPINDQTTCHNPDCNEMKFFKDLKKCGRCKSVMYCGQDCQKKDWANHKVVCKAPNK